MGDFEDLSAELAAAVERARKEAFEIHLSPLHRFSSLDEIIEGAGKSLEYIDRVRDNARTNGLFSARDSNSFNLDVWHIAEYIKAKDCYDLKGAATKQIAAQLGDAISEYVHRSGNSWPDEDFADEVVGDETSRAVTDLSELPVSGAGIPYEEVMEKLRRTALNARHTKLKFLLIGQTGVGKTSTVNSLFGEEIGSVGRHEPTTKTVDKFERVINGVPFLLFDPPGLCVSPNLPVSDFDYLNLIKEEVDEFHVMLFVTRLDFHRVTNDEYVAIERITAALGRECWQHALIVFTHANAIEPEQFKSDLKVRTELLRQVIATHAGEKMARAVLSVAIDNKSELTPDGKPWLPELFLGAFAKIDPKGALPFVIATASPNKPGDPSSGRRISLDDQQRERFYDSVQEKSGAEGWLALTYFGSAPVAIGAAVAFGPVAGLVAAGAVITVGVIGTLWSALRR